MQNKLYADQFFNDYSLGLNVPREIFYYKGNKWIVVDNSKGKCEIIPFESEEACMAYSRSYEELLVLIEELKFIKEHKCTRK